MTIRNGVATMMTEMKKADFGTGGCECALGDDAGDSEYDDVRDCGNDGCGNGNLHYHGDGEDDGYDGGITSR